jgi:hypothetical protein
MQSRLKVSNFKSREGVKVAAFLRDMFTHGVETLLDLFNGRPLRGHTIRVKLINNDTENVDMLGININGTISE